MLRHNQSRQQKYAIFQEIAKSASQYFNELKDKNERAKELDRMYSFYVVIGNFTGFTERYIQVFFGQRPVDTHNNTFVTENGATLLYTQAIDGSVICIVYPVWSEYMSTQYRSTTLYVEQNPEKIRHRISKDFKKFIKFARFSSLDVETTFSDRVLIEVLNTVCRTEKDGIIRRHRLHAIGYWIKFAGLSGSLIAFFSLFL